MALVESRTHYSVSINVPCDIRELYLIMPKQLFRRVIERLDVLRPQTPVWKDAKCKLYVYLRHEDIERLRAAYGGVWSGVRAAVDEAVKEFQEYLDALRNSLNGDCVRVADVARRLSADMGYKRNGAKRHAELILSYLGYTQRRIIGLRTYMCRPGVRPYIFPKTVTEDAVRAAIEELMAGCTTKICRVRVSRVIERLGVSQKNHAIIKDIAKRLGYEVERFNHKYYITKRRE
jgi:hypothetical protein